MHIISCTFSFDSVFHFSWSNSWSYSKVFMQIITLYQCHILSIMFWIYLALWYYTFLNITFNSLFFSKS
jgi:hypothetical protein